MSTSPIATALFCGTIVACSSAPVAPSTSDNRQIPPSSGRDEGATAVEPQSCAQGPRPQTPTQNLLAIDACGPGSRLTGAARTFLSPTNAGPFVPVVLFHSVCATVCAPDNTYGVTQADLASFLAALDSRGFEALSSRTYVNAMRGDLTNLPSRPILLTFDDSRQDAYSLASPLLEAAHATATMFVITAKPDANAINFMSWSDVVDAQHSGNWDIQLHAAGGHVQISVGVTDGVTTMAPFFANRRFDTTLYANEIGNLEPHASWKQRAEDDLALGMAALRAHLPDYEPNAFAVPYNDYGQNTSNDPQIAAELRAVFDGAFPVWFTQSPHPEKMTTMSHERGRYIVLRTTTVDQLISWVTDVSPRAQR